MDQDKEERTAMALVTWSDQMSVGVEKFDEEHRHLVTLLNALHARMMMGRGDEVVHDVLDQLVRYARTHFASEETLFRAHNYPQAAAHKKEHDELTAKAMDLQTAVNGGKIYITLPTMNFLKDWLTNHIMKVDMAYRPFFAAKGIK
jgi:hemerythrin-like metal-binding protein